MDTVTDSAIAFAQRTIHELVERYISWREESCSVRIAYEEWASSGRDERRLAYAGYLAALDQEEQAARAYAGHVDRIRRLRTLKPLNPAPSERK
jgi:hypothetical protein